ncbi:maturase K [Gossypium australe]|uniref:Maturase K n=1 Tax=Gossypium australe TaxID=47621 RepID=A0A5B6VMA4_9ROSI|nr:maturase K [Gossypium australe]
MSRAMEDDVKSNVSAPAEGTAPVKSGPVTLSQGGGAREAFLHMINVWYSEFVRSNLNTPPPPPHLFLSLPLVFDELSCTSEECMKPMMSLLRDSAYQWWNTLMSVVPRERITWEFFQEEFCKKYISQRFIDQKRKEFLELKQGQMTVIEYEREFVRLSKYAQVCVSTKAVFCKRFEDGLNEDIWLFVGILELKEFVVLVERACKAEELAKKKRKAMIKA